MRVSTLSHDTSKCLCTGLSGKHNLLTFEFKLVSYGCTGPHTMTQSVWLLWTSDRPVADTSTRQQTTHYRHTSVSPGGLEQAIPASERPQTVAVDRSATGSGFDFYTIKFSCYEYKKNLRGTHRNRNFSLQTSYRTPFVTLHSYF